MATVFVVIERRTMVAVDHGAVEPVFIANSQWRGVQSDQPVVAVLLGAVGNPGLAADGAVPRKPTVAADRNPYIHRSHHVHAANHFLFEHGHVRSRLVADIPFCKPQYHSLGMHRVHPVNFVKEAWIGAVMRIGVKDRANRPVLQVLGSPPGHAAGWRVVGALPHEDPLVVLVVPEMESQFVAWLHPCCHQLVSPVGIVLPVRQFPGEVDLHFVPQRLVSQGKLELFLRVGDVAELSQRKGRTTRQQVVVGTARPFDKAQHRFLPMDAILANGIRGCVARDIDPVNAVVTLEPAIAPPAYMEYRKPLRFPG